MILIDAIVLGVFLSVAVGGGKIRNLSREHLFGESLLIATLPLQFLWPQVSVALALSRPGAIVLWLVLMSALALILMANAPRRWMLGVAALGIACNILVIGLNQSMPVSVRSASEIGETRIDVRRALAVDYLHTELDDTSRLPFLADVIPIPGPSWHRGVVSVGDIALSLGLAAWVFSATRSPRVSDP